MMFGNCIKYSRPIPDLADSDETRVIVRLKSDVTDPRIIAFFELINQETLKSFSGLDFLAVDLVRRNKPIPQDVAKRLPRLIELGILDKFKKQYILSKRLMAQIGAASPHDIDRQKVQQRLEECGAEGASIGELIELLGKERGQVKWLLDALKREGLVYSKGERRAAKWYSANLAVRKS